MLNIALSSTTPGQESAATGENQQAQPTAAGINTNKENAVTPLPVEGQGIGGNGIAPTTTATTKRRRQAAATGAGIFYGNGNKQRNFSIRKITKKSILK
jgi:hypothetical protein